MRILHTSDWHLGKKLEHYPRLPEQIEILNEIIHIADEYKVDVVLIAGDLFDTYNPPAEATDLFYRSLKRLSKEGSRPIFAISGNHDSPERIQAPDPLARECGIFFSGYPNSVIPSISMENGFEITKSEEGFIECQVPSSPVPLRIIHTPYANELRLKAYTGGSEQELRDALEHKWMNIANEHCDTNGINILLTHLFVVPKGGETPEEPDDEKPILHVGGAQAIYTQNIPKQIQYTALGHLHRKIEMNSENAYAVYSGSPLSYSFAEAEQQKSVCIVDIETNKKPTITYAPLRKGKALVRKRFEKMDEALKWLTNNPDCLVELTMVTNNFLTADERKALQLSHNGIISVIPEIKNKDILNQTDHNNIDLSKSTEDLFKDFFLARTGQEVNDEIISLFKEINAQ